jgi:hypothetical protein
MVISFNGYNMSLKPDAKHLFLKKAAFRKFGEFILQAGTYIIKCLLSFYVPF